MRRVENVFNLQNSYVVTDSPQREENMMYIYIYKIVLLINEPVLRREITTGTFSMVNDYC